MPLFQNSVIKKYTQELNSQKVQEAYGVYQTYFLDPAIQVNIREAKEEQFQEGFLRKLFVNVLGYTLYPDTNFNLTTELKNTSNSKKVDGAVLIDNKAVAVIELKGTETTDLSKIEVQAFGYKNNQQYCTYVITSNFEKLRFYIDNTIEFIEFNLFTLSREDFNLLWLCLSYKSIEQNIPKRIKEESLSQEDAITKMLYRDYSLFKRELYQNLVALNPQFEPLTLFKKSQKLLDRFLFLFFAEDRQLLPPNSVRLILNDWKDLQDRDVEIPLFDRFKKYFEYLNTGYKGKRYDVFAYNGGLFKPDNILDAVTINDQLLYDHTLKLSEYDFVSEIDVNILGHIFENSLNELDEIKAQLEGQDVDKSKTKRKKDGVFYTPKYITKYIVENTVGKLCIEKKAELQINEEDYITDKKRQKKTIQELADKLTNYRNWLLQLTICDPACGSGAFLNQALDFLINEHKYVDELQAKLFGDAMVLSDFENSILENNLYGVDLNEESVEIAKLSLWLRTAQPNRKLNDLNNNIKCGNSLIDDPAVAGEKAFNWHNEFQKVFEKGGFDVVIGNPPYLRIQGLRDAYPEQTKYYEQKFSSATGNFDIYVLFIEMSYKLIKTAGAVSLILPHKFLISDFGNGIRKYLLTNLAVDTMIHFGSELVFQDASTYTCIIFLSKKENSVVNFKHILPTQLFIDTPFNQIPYAKLDAGQWILNNNQISLVLDKIFKHPLQLKDVFDRFVQGIITGKDAVFCVSGNIKGNYLEIIDGNNKIHLIECSILKPHLRGEDVNKYKSLVNKEWLIFPYKFISEKAELYTPYEMQVEFPNTYEYLKQYEHELRERENKNFDNDFWYQYSRNQAISVLGKPKIITPEVCFGGSMSLDLNNFYHNSKCHTLLLKEESVIELKSILPILNSQLFWFYISNTGNVLRGGYIGVKRRVLELFPIPSEPIQNAKEFIGKTDLMLSLNKELQDLSQKFQRSLQRKFEIASLSIKLQNWYTLTYDDFIKELGKIKIKLSLSQEAEWEDYFLQESKKAIELKSKIEVTDKEIDSMVYELYGLTEDEIKIVEGK